MRRDMWKIIKETKVNPRYDMNFAELQAILDKAKNTHCIYSAFIECFIFGYAQGMKAAQNKGRSC